MCPGGQIVPASTNDNEIVINGMSNSKRNSPFANSGIVVEIQSNDIYNNFEKYGALAGMKFQEKIENDCFIVAEKSQLAPAQRVTDFINNKFSNTLPKTSYLPGIKSCEINKILPDFITKRLQNAFRSFDKKLKGFITNEAIIHAVESRTSAPVKIIRDKETMQHIHIQGLYPCGEGAGYAGGIISSAIDGENCAEKIINNTNITKK
jgi:hypothetical protein